MKVKLTYNPTVAITLSQFVDMTILMPFLDDERHL